MHARLIGLLFVGLFAWILLACEAAVPPAPATPVGQATQAAQATQAKTPAETSAQAVAKTPPEVLPDKVVVYYFHGDVRCHTCTTLEALADQAIKQHFADELASGFLEWKVVNTDREANRHFVDDYQLYTKSLVVSALKDGKQIKWKNCAKIWELVRTPPDYERYVVAEIRAYLDGV